MKRVLTIQDISGIGKCSLTEALPIISAAGIECAVLPTTVLSTHTAFEGFTFHDLTDDMPGITDHWEALGMEFSCIYTGYLGSIRQVELVEKTIDRFRKEDTLVVVDPAMADNGKLYAGFAPEFVGAMKGLCAKADVVVPNITEAAFLSENSPTLGPAMRSSPASPSRMTNWAAPRTTRRPAPISPTSPTRNRSPSTAPATCSPRPSSARSKTGSPSRTASASPPNTPSRRCRRP